MADGWLILYQHHYRTFKLAERAITRESVTRGSAKETCLA